jgi:hypothetical protein
MQSRRCYGETKFFRQCPRYVAASTLEHCFCYEHVDQRHVRLAEIHNQKNDGHDDISWAPLGFFETNRPKKTIINHISDNRLKELTSDDQNVHTAEVQQGVGAAIKRLRTWARFMNIKTERDLASLVEKSCGNDELGLRAVEHLRHCYQWNDETLMFGVTYPQLASWVWARIHIDSENRDLLIERFFEEVTESSGQCLNGNMARLMNVFAALDLEMSPQEVFLSREQLQALTAKAVAESKEIEEALQTVTELLERANVEKNERQNWLQSVKEAFL